MHAYDKSISENGGTKKRIFFNFLVDCASFVLIILLINLYKYNWTSSHIKAFITSISLYFIIFCIISLINGKYEIKRTLGYYKLFHKHSIAWIFSVIICIIIIYTTGIDILNQTYIITAAIFIYVLQFSLLTILYQFRRAKTINEHREISHLSSIKQVLLNETNGQAGDNTDNNKFVLNFKIEDIPSELDVIENIEVRKFIYKYSFVDNNKRLLLDTGNYFNIQTRKDLYFDQIVNLRIINNLRYINKFFEVVYTKLRHNAVFIVPAETIDLRKKRLSAKIFRPIAILIRAFDFAIHRILPRLPYFRKIYFAIWKYGSKRISYAEALGRLYSCGFEYIDEIEADGKLWFAVQKKHQPALDYQATYDPIIKLKRIGKNKKQILVYKFRTMHPYSEFLQDFVYKQNKLDKGGKFKDDFRISTFGKFMRKAWIDELPMLMNLLKGDIKLVGVRPLSKQYFDLYPKDMQEFRTKYKPGLLPPFYFDMPETFEEVVESERKYLIEYEKSKLKTDIKYFFKIFVNIVFKKARSK